MRAETLLPPLRATFEEETVSKVVTPSEEAAMTPPLFYGSGDAFQRNTSALPFYEEKEGLLAFLIQELPMSMLGTGDEEVLRRKEEMDSVAVAAISHEEFFGRVNIRHAFPESPE
jgi:hypothetical protein